VKLLVLGGGVAGLAMALAAGRGGHEVVLVERDTDTPAGDANGVFEGWQRTGVAQFRQPHNFLGLGRRLLRDRVPDVYRELLGAGAVEVEQFRFLAGARAEPGDQDLATIGCRRPVFEAALRRAVEAEPAIEVRSGCRVSGLVLSGGRPTHVEGVVLAGGERLAADLVIDACGRSSRAMAWLEEAGLGSVAERSSGCGLIYYSRHFQRREGVAEPPYGSVLAGPRGDLGYVAYAIFVGDSRTFAVIFMAPPGDRAFRELRHTEAYMRAARLLPGVAAWIDPDAATPLTPVLPFGQVTNTVRDYLTGAGPVAPGCSRSATRCATPTPASPSAPRWRCTRPSPWPTCWPWRPTTTIWPGASRRRWVRTCATATARLLRRTAAGPAGGAGSRSTSPTRPPAWPCSSGR
jgi:2-polyprenyl-6-methoxyphenol hydroxylase-like FAD-dependent oxidoreductase